MDPSAQWVSNDLALGRSAHVTITRSGQLACTVLATRMAMRIFSATFGEPQPDELMLGWVGNNLLLSADMNAVEDVVPFRARWQGHRHPALYMSIKRVLNRRGLEVPRGFRWQARVEPYPDPQHGPHLMIRLDQVVPLPVVRGPRPTGTGETPAPGPQSGAASE